MRDGPVIDLSQVVFVDKFGESLAPVVPYLVGGGGSSGDEFGQVGDEIVAAALEELGREVGGPVGAVGFERVGEDGVGGVSPKALTRGSPTDLRWVATASWEKGSRTQPSAPTAARLTCWPVWLSMKTRATRGRVGGWRESDVSCS